MASANQTSLPAPSTQRLDKWLWFARVIKTRTLAAGLVTDGKVRINRQRVDKPSATVRPGDVVTVTVSGDVRVLKVLQPGIRRGPPAEACLLFDEVAPPSGRAPPNSVTYGASSVADGNSIASSSQPPSADATSRHASEIDGQVGGAAVGQRAPGSGRPTKRDRRQMNRATDQEY